MTSLRNDSEIASPQIRDALCAPTSLPKPVHPYLTTPLDDVVETRPTAYFSDTSVSSRSTSSSSTSSFERGRNRLTHGSKPISQQTSIRARGELTHDNRSAVEPLDPLEPREEYLQPHPLDEREKRYIEDCLTDLPNRIHLRIDQDDLGVLFLIPSQINRFVDAVFTKYADPQTNRLSEEDFEKLILDAQLLQENPAAPTTQAGRSTQSSRRWNKTIQCIFRHRDNPKGEPIGKRLPGRSWLVLAEVHFAIRGRSHPWFNPEQPPYGYESFLRILHRLARFKYRRLRFRDDEAVNALVTALIRSGAWLSKDKEKKDQGIQFKVPSTEEATQSSVLAVTEGTQKSLPSVRSEGIMTSPRRDLKPSEPSASTSTPLDTAKPVIKAFPKLAPVLKPPVREKPALPKKKMPLLVAPPSAKKLPMVKAPASPPRLPKRLIKVPTALPKAPVEVAPPPPILQAAAVQTSDIESETQEASIVTSTATSTRTSIREERELDWLERKFYSLYRRYADTLRATGLFEVIDEEDLIALYAAILEEKNHLVLPELRYDAIDFFDLKVMTQEISNDYFGDEAPDMDADDRYYEIIRQFYLPLLYDHTSGDPQIQSSFHPGVYGAYHVVDKEGYAIGPDNQRLRPLARLQPGGYLQNEKGDVLPGTVYTMSDEVPIAGSPRYISLTPLRSGSSASGAEVKGPVSAEHENAFLLKTPIPMPLTKQVANPIPTPHIVSPAMPLSPGPVLSRRRNSTPDEEDISTTNKRIGWDPEPDDAPRRYSASPYVVNVQGNIVVEATGMVVEGFTTGPENTVIGPDARPVWNARIALDGRHVELLQAEKARTPSRSGWRQTPIQHIMKNEHLQYDRFPAGYESESSSGSLLDEDDDARCYATADEFMSRRPVGYAKDHKKIHGNPLLSGAPAHLLRPRVHLRGRTCDFNAMRHDARICTPELDAMSTSTEDSVHGREAVIEGYVWPPVVHQTEPGFQTPRFNV